MEIYKELIERAISLARAKRVKRMVAGIHYVFAEVERSGCGLAYMDRGFLETCCESSETTYWRQPADLILKGYLGYHPIEVPLALAVMNSLFNHRKEILKENIQDPFESISLDSEDEILMIGYFEPLYKKLQGRVKRILVIEKEAINSVPRMLRDVESIRLAIVTSATLANKTLHYYFPVLEKIPEVMLLGPSTPLAPEIFKDYPISWLCGVAVKDGEQLFRLVCEGKGTPTFFKANVLEKVNLKIRRS